MINLRHVIRQLGALMGVLSISILAIAAWSALLQPDDSSGLTATTWSLLITVAIGMAAAAGFWWTGGSAKDFLGRREALLLVALSWLVGAALAATPFRLWAMLGPTVPMDHPFHNFAACYFEAMSGLTTTGATVLGDVDHLPRGLLLWRAMTHWLGGLGIVVLFVAVLPTLGVGGKKLFQVEAPGPATQGVRPRIRETARLLWVIYVALTLAQIAALLACGMSLFDSVCHTLATLATGGFSTHNASIGGYHSPAIDTVTILFMLLAGVNFGIYYQIIRRRWRSVWSDPELHLYLAIVLIAGTIVTISIWGRPLQTTDPAVSFADTSLLQSIRYGFFQVISIQTTTGFCTADFTKWGPVAKAVLMILMFVGASAGSTGGGIKVIRCLIVFKVMIAEVERIFRPNVVRTIRVGKMTIDDDLRLGTLVYVLGILILFAAGTIALIVIEPAGQLTFKTAATAAAATLNNIGPGLGQVGAIENYGWFTAPSMIVMSILMALGRLEVYAIFVLFVPSFWRRQ